MSKRRERGRGIRSEQAREIGEIRPHKTTHIHLSIKYYLSLTSFVNYSVSRFSSPFLTLCLSRFARISFPGRQFMTLFSISLCRIRIRLLRSPIHPLRLVAVASLALCGASLPQKYLFFSRLFSFMYFQVFCSQRFH